MWIEEEVTEKASNLKIEGANSNEYESVIFYRNE